MVKRCHSLIDFSSDDNVRDELAKRLRITRKRKAANHPDTLLQLSKRATIDNHKYFLGKKETPINVLPNHLVQGLLSDISADAMEIISNNWRDTYPLDRKKFCDFILLLLNPSITKHNFDLTLARYHEEFAQHLIKNCSKIKKLTCAGFLETFHNLSIYGPGRVEGMNLDALMLVNPFPWPKLEHLCAIGFESSSETVELISKTLPELFVLELTLGEDFDFETGLPHLWKMEKLNHLVLDFLKNRMTDDDQKNIALMVKRVPKLRVLTFLNLPPSNDQNMLVQCLARICPEKRLFVNELRLTNPQDFETWPPGLQTDTMVLRGRLTTGNFDACCLSKMPFPPRKIVFNRYLEFSDGKIFSPLLEAWGANVTDLKVWGCFKIDVQFVLKNCPKLENLSLTYRSVSGSENLTPSHFKNMQRINMKCFWEERVNPDAQNVQKMLWLGSDKCNQSFVVFYRDQNYRILLEALEENPNAFNKVEDVTFSIGEKIATTSEVDDHQVIDLAIQVAYLLMLRSPYLKKIQFDGHEETLNILHSLEEQHVMNSSSAHRFKHFFELIDSKVIVVKAYSRTTSNNPPVSIFSSISKNDD